MTENKPLRAVFERIGTPVDQQSTPLSAEEERDLRGDLDALGPQFALHEPDTRRLLATLDAARERPSALDPFRDRDEHERQSLAGRHMFEPGCPFCFFDIFDAEERAELGYARLPEPDAGEGTTQHSQGRDVRPSAVGVLAPSSASRPTPDTTEATLRTRVKRFLLAYDSTDAWEVVDAEVDALRAALQHAAVQPEGERTTLDEVERYRRESRRDPNP